MARRGTKSVRFTIPLRPLTEGIVRTASDLQMPLGAAAHIENLIYMPDGALRTFFGSQYLGKYPLDGPVLLIDQYITSKETLELLAITTKSLYKFDVTNNEWTQIATNYDFSIQFPPWSEIIDDVFVFGSRTQPVRYYDGAVTGDYITVLPTGLTSLYADCALYYNGRLFLGSTVEDDDWIGYRLRYSSLSDPRDFDAPGAGFVDFRLSPYPIVSLAPLGEYLVVYKKRGIYFGRETGNIDFPYDFSLIDDSMGPLAGRLVTSYLREHWWVGWDDLYSLTTSGLAPISGKIGKDLIANLASSAEVTAWTGFSEKYSMVLFWLPEIGSYYPSKAWVFHHKLGSWTTVNLKLPAEITAGGYSTRMWYAKLGEMTGKIGDTTTKIGDPLITPSLPSDLIGLSNGWIVEWSEDQVDWLGQPIEWTWESTDLVIPHPETRAISEFFLLEVRVLVTPIRRVVDMECSVSLDRGATWSDPDNMRIWREFESAKLFVAHFFTRTFSCKIRIKGKGPCYIRDISLVVSPITEAWTDA